MPDCRRSPSRDLAQRGCHGPITNTVRSLRSEIAPRAARRLAVTDAHSCTSAVSRTRNPWLLVALTRCVEIHAKQTAHKQVDGREDHSGMIPARQAVQARSSNRAPLGTVGGRPSLRRLLVSYLPAATLRCQASSVAGVTGKPRSSGRGARTGPARRTTPGRPGRNAPGRRGGAYRVLVPEYQ